LAHLGGQISQPAVVMAGSILASAVRTPKVFAVFGLTLFAAAAPGFGETRLDTPSGCVLMSAY